MLFHIFIPKEHFVALELDDKAIGHECLEKVCERLGIVESDYFGLRFVGPKQELLWLNLRNTLRCQLQQSSGPMSLYFTVKFFVPAHCIQQEVTRRVIRRQLEQKLMSGEVRVPHDLLPILAALSACAESQSDYRSRLHTYCSLGQGLANDQQFLYQCEEQWQMMCDLNPSSCDYHFIQHLSMSDEYGCHIHAAQDDSGQSINIYVMTAGIQIRDQHHKVLQSYSYSQLKEATLCNRCVYLTVVPSDGIPTSQPFRLSSRKGAQGLVRCITEMHSFYRCDTVQEQISSQCSRDLKGAITSLFSENSDAGKKYSFDIQRTCREAYDHARRKLYVKSASLDSTGSERLHDDDSDDNSKSDECKICYCEESSVRFVPCAHVCCARCASRLQQCPFCRADVTELRNFSSATHTDISIQ